ncbi:MAG: MBL fold metallo-hydrolase [Verrucomicrobiota bacterium]|nr:MBL fold metallo-hydrolase [Verrucomicrobiota bacterium]
MQQQPEAAGAASTLVRFWGVRGSIPTPGPATVQVGGNTSCVEVRVGDRILILDAGTGLRLLGLQLLQEFGFRPLDLTLLLTHTHWDHIQGLPFFSPLYHDRNTLHILGLQGSRHSLERVLNSQMEIPFFPIGLRDVPGNIRIEELNSPGITLDNIHITACKANHPGHCVGYKIQTPDGTIAFFPDHETIPQAPGTDAVTAFLRGVDLLIMDSQYDEAHYENHRGWGHGCVKDVVTQALKAEVRRLVLFHHDPCSDDAAVARMEEEARAQVRLSGGSLEVMAAREGLELSLP